jgi:hypothetical protein
MPAIRLNRKPNPRLRLRYRSGKESENLQTAIDMLDDNTLWWLRFGSPAFVPEISGSTFRLLTGVRLLAWSLTMP